MKTGFSVVAGQKCGRPLDCSTKCLDLCARAVKSISSILYVPSPTAETIQYGAAQGLCTRQARCGVSRHLPGCSDWTEAERWEMKPVLGWELPSPLRRHLVPSSSSLSASPIPSLSIAHPIHRFRPTFASRITGVPARIRLPPFPHHPSRHGGTAQTQSPGGGIGSSAKEAKFHQGSCKQSQGRGSGSEGSYGHPVQRRLGW